MDHSLEKRLGALLYKRGWTFCAAESCTGGLVSHRMTNIAGSSAWVIGGLVAYANEVKQGILGVQEATLTQYGAVSEETAREMVLGALRLFGTNIAVSITGIAGPGGGTPTKPVGLTYIGACVRGDVPLVRRHVWEGDREGVKAASSDEALRMALELVESAS